MKGTQSNIFRNGEGDAWFERNRAAILDRSAPDGVEYLVECMSERQRIASVCDVGCANGWRLARLATRVANGARLAGFDASPAAIADGRGRWPALELAVGVAHQPPFEPDRRFDLVITSFVLHWVGRDEFPLTVAAIDGLLTWGGYLILADFLPDVPSKRAYHHLPNQDVKTYKQDYAEAFLGLGIYLEVARITFDHNKLLDSSVGNLRLGSVVSGDRCCAVLLQKTDQRYLTI